ncbi:MAG TPA: PASTA domain-containing protein [Sporichthyaceae bacterium]
MGGRRGPWENARQAWERLHGWVSAAHADGGVPALEALDDIGEVRRVLDQAELEAVRTARRHGRSWAEIATRLGVTRQSAWERWRDLDEPAAAASVVEALPLTVVVDEVLGRAAGEARRRATVRVPNVVGLQYDDARDVLRDMALVAIVPDPDAPPIFGGTVTDQSPEAGAKVPAGSAVTLWVERGGGSGVREPRRPGPDPRRAVEHAPEPVPGDRAVG